MLLSHRSDDTALREDQVPPFVLSPLSISLGDEPSRFGSPLLMMHDGDDFDDDFDDGFDEFDEDGLDDFDELDEDGDEDEEEEDDDFDDFDDDDDF